MQDYPSVTKFMATKLVTFTPDMDIRTAMDTLLKRGISGAPVLDSSDKLIGMLSEVDCLKILLAGPYNEGPDRPGTVGDFMSTSVHTIDHDSTVLDAAMKFVNSSIKRLPVCRNGQLVGQISRVDVLRAISKMPPDVRIVPDSWKKRMPSEPKHKQSHYTENS